MPKDPAAVALGKKRQAKMTAEERKAFQEAGAEAAAAANRKRLPDERRAIARKAAMTRRICPSWIQPTPSNPVEKAVVPRGELAQLGACVDELSDEELERIAAALAGRLDR